MYDFWLDTVRGAFALLSIVLASICLPLYFAFGVNLNTILVAGGITYAIWLPLRWKKII